MNYFSISGQLLPAPPRANCPENCMVSRFAGALYAAPAFRLDKSALPRRAHGQSKTLRISAADKAAVQCTAKENARPNALKARSGFAPQGFLPVRVAPPCRLRRARFEKPARGRRKLKRLTSVCAVHQMYFCISSAPPSFFLQNGFALFFIFCKFRRPHLPASFASCHAGFAACRNGCCRGFFARPWRSRAQTPLPACTAPLLLPRGALSPRSGL